MPLDLLPEVPDEVEKSRRTNDAYEAYWNGWNDACDANIQLSWWKRAIAELKHAVTRSSQDIFMTEWQPLDSAPKDGTEFIYQHEGGAVSTCAWRPDDCGFDWYDIHGDQIAYPRRWIKLPKSSVN